MKICIYGAGAIGGYLGAKLTEIGADVTLIARGPHYQAIKQDGLRLRKDGKELVVYPKCVDTAEKAGKQDYIFVTLKAHSVPGCLDAFEVLMKDDTSFVWGVNGIRGGISTITLTLISKIKKLLQLIQMEVNGIELALKKSSAV